MPDDTNPSTAVVVTIVLAVIAIVAIALSAYLYTERQNRIAACHTSTPPRAGSAASGSSTAGSSTACAAKG